MISVPDLEVMLPDYLVQQRWFAAGPDGSHPRDVADLQVRIVRSEVWREGDPGLLWAIVEANASPPNPEPMTMTSGFSRYPSGFRYSVFSWCDCVRNAGRLFTITPIRTTR